LAYFALKPHLCGRDTYLTGDFGLEPANANGALEREGQSFHGCINYLQNACYYKLGCKGTAFLWNMQSPFWSFLISGKRLAWVLCDKKK
jgi:hypothetical protein